MERVTRLQRRDCYARSVAEMVPDRPTAWRICALTLGCIDPWGRRCIGNGCGRRIRLHCATGHASAPADRAAVWASTGCLSHWGKSTLLALRKRFAAVRAMREVLMNGYGSAV